jgi:hypothetical protein
LYYGLIHAARGIREWLATRSNDPLLERGFDKYIAVQEGVAGGSGVLPMKEEAEAAGIRIASSAIHNTRSVPGGEQEVSAGKRNNGSSDRSEGVHDALGAARVNNGEAPNGCVCDAINAVDPA